MDLLGDNLLSSVGNKHRTLHCRWIFLFKWWVRRRLCQNSKSYLPQPPTHLYFLLHLYLYYPITLLFLPSPSACFIHHPDVLHHLLPYLRLTRLLLPKPSTNLPASLPFHVTSYYPLTLLFPLFLLPYIILITSLTKCHINWMVNMLSLIVINYFNSF